MWICTPFGILMPALRPPHTVPKGDKRLLQVRARERAYLDTFRDRYCSDLGKTQHFPNHDYPWKAYVSHRDLAMAVAEMTLDIDYEKFKPTTETKRGLKSKELAKRLHNCYSSMWSVQVTHGDGTGGWSSYSSKSVCERDGHFYTAQGKMCTDCKRPRPRKLKLGTKGGFRWIKGDEKYARQPAYRNTWKPKNTTTTVTWAGSNSAPHAGAVSNLTNGPYGSTPCSECGGGYWQGQAALDDVWVPHSDDCLQDDGCPECWALAGEPHDKDCSQQAAEIDDPL